MNGNIDDWLDIAAGNTTVTVTGWIDFRPGDPNNVQIWVGIGQGDKKGATAVYGGGWVAVARPAAATRTSWTCPARIRAGGGTFGNGTAEAGAVVVADGVNPYPWGRDVKLKQWADAATASRDVRFRPRRTAFARRRPLPTRP